MLGDACREKHLATILVIKKLAGVAPELTLALKQRRGIARNPKQMRQLPHKGLKRKEKYSKQCNSLSLFRHFLQLVFFVKAL